MCVCVCACVVCVLCRGCTVDPDKCDIEKGAPGPPGHPGLQGELGQKGKLMLTNTNHQ